MAFIEEDWAKTAKPFTEAQIAKIRAGYFNGSRAKEIARELNCCTRSVHKWFSRFKADFGPVKRNRKPRSSENTSKPISNTSRFDPIAHREKRFYRGSFEL